MGDGEERKAEEDSPGRTIEQVVQDTIALRPWAGKIQELIAPAQQFVQKRPAIVKMLSEMEGREAAYSDILEFFGGEPEILFAVMLQNSLQPKNSNRTDAIKAGKYVEIESLEQARAFIGSLVEANLTNELRSVESTIMNQMNSRQAYAEIGTIVFAPDVYIAAVAMSNSSFFEGHGDRNKFIELILESNPATIPDLARKLKMVTQKQFMGLTLYSDRTANPERAKRNQIYRLWMHCCRKSNTLTLEEMISFQPHAEAALRFYDRFVDENSKLTLNAEEHAEYRASGSIHMANKARARQAQNAENMML